MANINASTKHLPKFKKGQSGNPKGRPKLTLEERELRSLTIETYRDVIELALTGKREELRALVRDRNTPSIQAGVAKALLIAIDVGDAETLERFASRIVGKIPDVVIHEHNVRIQAQININQKILSLSDESLIKRLKKIDDAF